MSLDESYSVLGLKPGATLQEVRRAYHERIKFFHPDRHQASPGLLRKATEESKKLNLAYDRIRKSHIVTSATNAPRPKTPAGAPVAGKSFIVPSIDIEMNWVAPGRFTMGSPPTEAGRSNDEGPQTEVTITRGFWLGKFAVTQEQWKALATDTPGVNPEPSYFRGERLPVEQVSWTQCQEWIQALNNSAPTGLAYRMPTEAEWEFACRAGSSTRYCFGDEDAGLLDYAWFCGNSANQIHPVGEKKPNTWGFHDMHGNVWEWTQSRYGPLPGGSVTDPAGPILGLNRVFRGGAWGLFAHRCRSAYRVWNAPAYRDYSLGFRLALAEID